jgi:catechol 2,3-dioxygenase-like lactoylglutathione lyase family enzyme
LTSQGGDCGKTRQIWDSEIVDFKTNTTWRSFIFRLAKAIRAGRRKLTSSFSALITLRFGISNTDASLKFYRDLLGLRKAGESENFGTEQEHLNQVFGAHLRITEMRASAGPGVEFLEYLTPRDGRPRPADARANDPVHWQTMVVVNDVDALAQKLRQAQVGFVLSGSW